MAIVVDTNSAFEFTSAALVTGYPFTYYQGFNAATSGSDLYRIFSLSDTGTNDNFWLVALGGGAAPNKARFLTRASSLATTADTSTNYTASIDNSIVAVGASATDRRVYLNAAGVGSDATNKTPAGLDATGIGVFNDDGTDGPAFSSNNCNVSRAALWDVELFIEEWEALNHGFSPIDIKLGGLVMFLELIRDNAFDIISGNTFTKVSAPAVVENPPNLIPSYEGLAA